MSSYFCGDHQESNPYEVLGIPNCSHNRKLTLKRGKTLKAIVHPDKNPENELAEESFVVAQAAIEFLSDRKKKQQCDDYLDYGYRCFRATKEGGPEATVLKNFFRRKAELDRLKRYDKWAALCKSYYEGLKSFPRHYWAKIGKLLGQTYKRHVGRVCKTYRDLGRWIGRVPYSEKPKTRKQSLRTTPTTAVKAAEPSRAARPGAVPYPPTAHSNFPTTNAPPRRTLSITETKTVTNTETETKTETDTITVTAFGIDIKKYAREIENLATSINPRYVGVAAAAAGVFVVCVAGGWYLVQRGMQGQQQAVGNNEEPDIAVSEDEDSETEAAESENSDDGGSSDDDSDNEESDDGEMYEKDDGDVNEEDQSDTEDESDEDDRDDEDGEDGRSGGAHGTLEASTEHDVGEVWDDTSNGNDEEMRGMNHTVHRGNAVSDESGDGVALYERTASEIAGPAAVPVKAPVTIPAGAPAIATASTETNEQSTPPAENFRTPKRRSERIAASAKKPEADGAMV